MNNPLPTTPIDNQNNNQNTQEIILPENTTTQENAQQEVVQQEQIENSPTEAAAGANTDMVEALNQTSEEETVNQQMQAAAQNLEMQFDKMLPQYHIGLNELGNIVLNTRISALNQTLPFLRQHDLTVVPQEQYNGFVQTLNQGTDAVLNLDKFFKTMNSIPEDIHAPRLLNLERAVNKLYKKSKKKKKKKKTYMQ